MATERENREGGLASYRVRRSVAWDEVAPRADAGGAYRRTRLSWHQTMSCFLSCHPGHLVAGANGI
jgi:hypothetical protein